MSRKALSHKFLTKARLMYITRTWIGQSIPKETNKYQAASTNLSYSSDETSR